MITNNPAEAMVAGEALRAITRDADKELKDEQDKVERATVEAKAAEKGEAEGDDSLNDIDEN